MSHSVDQPSDPLDDPYRRRSTGTGGTEDAWDTLARVALVLVGGVFLLAVVAYAVVLFLDVNS